MENISDKNKFVIAIGFFLLILVAAATFLRPSLKNEAKSNLQIAPTDSAGDKPQGISSAELSKMILTKDDLVIIDARDEIDFKKEHILNSKNIPADRLAAALGTMEKEKTYVVVAMEMAPQDITALQKLFSDEGFTNYFYLTGGFLAWKNQYGPTISDGDLYSFADQSKATYINADELKKLLDGENNIQIIDLRKDAQFKEGHIKNAINIFLDDLEVRKNEIARGKKIILYDNDGLWAFKGAVRLYDMGIFNITALSDGLDGWKKKSFEVVK